ncbi:hypothetical protein DAPPUDRAFT_261558 [Daphnia pulex]|uniref:Uncharacterized protein n=1 Tax=Daphnia pulex TaxID=6669 RepID=E9HL75_DAPPU|nr:hypothetical protein DAPPUDRAFT_261558 [Daphnia pulex]|eukprot:EFX67509.1 hypothetical protein DAPPUDRAFT_261558 [Daphnia pulex]
MAERGSRTEVKFLRKELATQLEECTRAHNLYRQSNDLDHVPSEDWIIQLENVTATYNGRIDEYIRTVNRPPSAVPCNPSIRSRQSIQSNTPWLDPNHPGAFQQRENENPFDDQASASISEIRDLPSDMESLDEERLAREDLERRLQQLQTDMAAKEKAGPENEDNAATAALTEELQTLRLQMNQWKQIQDAEMANRIKLEKSLRDDIEKQKRELEEEKLTRQTEKHRYEREKKATGKILGPQSTSVSRNIMRRHPPTKQRPTRNHMDSIKEQDPKNHQPPRATEVPVRRLTRKMTFQSARNQYSRIRRLIKTKIAM